VLYTLVPGPVRLNSNYIAHSHPRPAINLRTRAWRPPPPPGALVLQDRSSCISALALRPPAGAACIDTCASPGNKTTHLASFAHKGKVTAFERDPFRLKTLKVRPKYLHGCGTCASPQISRDYEELALKIIKAANSLPRVLLAQAYSVMRENGLFISPERLRLHCLDAHVRTHLPLPACASSFLFSFFVSVAWSSWARAASCGAWAATSWTRTCLRPAPTPT